MEEKIKIPQYPPAKILKAVEKLRYFLIRISRKLAPANVNIMEMVQGFYVSRAIGLAVKLNISDYLHNGSKSISELALLTNCHEESLYRMMRMLASQGIYIEKKSRVFANNNLSRTMLDKDDTMHYMISHQVNGFNWSMYGELEYVIRTGENAFKKVSGMELFKFLEANPEKNDEYNKAMTNSSVMLGYAILSEYNFKNAKRVIDIGGGHGVLLSLILKKHKHLDGIVFDLPHVVNQANQIFIKFGIENRTEIISGNFFESVPSNADIYLLKSIIHNLTDIQAIELLKKIKSVLPVNGKILVFEPIIESNNGRYSFAKLFDVQMLVGTAGGKERTLDEYKDLFKKSEVKLKRVIPTAAPFSIIELT